MGVLIGIDSVWARTSDVAETLDTLPFFFPPSLPIAACLNSCLALESEPLVLLNVVVVGKPCLCGRAVRSALAAVPMTVRQ